MTTFNTNSVVVFVDYITTTSRSSSIIIITRFYLVFVIVPKRILLLISNSVGNFLCVSIDSRLFIIFSNRWLIISTIMTTTAGCRDRAGLKVLLLLLLLLMIILLI